MLKRWALGLAFSLAASTAVAGELDGIKDIGQANFKLFSQDLAGAVGYKAVGDAEPMGIIGFDVGIEFTATSLESASIWDDAGGQSLSTLLLPKIYLQKGLPFNVDVGAYYIKVPSTDIEAWGAELKYAILEGTIATPALAVRGAYSGVFGVEQLEFETKTLEILISKGILFFTPYAGIGRQWSTSTPKAEAATAGLKEESFSDTKTFVGIVFNPLIFNISLELDKVGDVSSTSLKLGLKF